MLKRALSIEALLYCIKNCPGPAEWILESAIEVFAYPIFIELSLMRRFPALSASTIESTLQGVIGNRRLDTFCRIVQVVLQSPLNVSSAQPLSPDRRSSSATCLPSLDFADSVPYSRLLSHLIFLLRTWALPETEALCRAGLDDRSISELRNRIAHLLFDLTRLATPEGRSKRGCFWR